MKNFYEYEQDRKDSLYIREGDNNCPLHYHAKFELIFNLKNEKKIVIGQEEYLLKENNFAIAFPYIEHRFFNNQNSKQIVIAIPISYVYDYERLFSNKILINPVITENSVCTKLKSIIYEIIENKSDSYICKALCSLLLKIIINVNGLKDKCLKSDSSLMKNILIYLENNYNKTVNLTNLSKEFGFSKNYMSKLFNNLIGTDISDYVNNLRIKKSIEKMQSGNVNVAEICFECGFNSIASFYRNFKKYLKISPKQFILNNVKA